MIFLKKYWLRYSDHFLLGILSLSIPLFFYKLGQSSLGSWDEAWYASISQNMLKTGDIFRLIYNGTLFADKPPGGMWITAMFFKLFGISALTARIGSAICGVLSLVVIYLLGKKLFNRMVGFASAIALLSSTWFLYRARSGNLDAPLTFFYLLTVYLAVKASENKKYLIPFAISFGYLALVKGVVFMLILIPVVVIIFWKNKIYKLNDLILLTIISLGIFGSWIVIQAMTDPSQAIYHFSHSLRNSSLKNDFGKSIALFKFYLHNGIGKWFWPGVLGIMVGPILRRRKFVILSVICLAFSIPFIFSPEVHIWHLIPLHPFMILAFFGVFYEIGSSVLNLRHLKINKQFQDILLSIGMIVITVYFGYPQLKSAWYQFIDIPAFITDEEILATEARKYPGKLYIDGDFVPAATFYADRPVVQVSGMKLDSLFDREENFLLITNEWRLDEAKIPTVKYTFIKKDRDKVLIKVDNQ